MFNVELKCTKCKRKKKIDFKSLDEYEKFMETPAHDCGGKLERYFGGGKAPGIKTTSSPNRY
jgi:hypothetical protein